MKGHCHRESQGQESDSKISTNLRLCVLWVGEGKTDLRKMTVNEGGVLPLLFFVF